MTIRRFDFNAKDSKTARFLSGLGLSGLIAACSSEALTRTGYETVQNARDLQCQQNLSSPCPPRESYDGYQRKLLEHEASH